MKPLSPLAGALCVLLLPLAALAHQPGSSRLVLLVQDRGAAELRWDVALADADLAVQLDAHGNRDGVVDPAEVAAGEAVLFAYAESRLQLAAEGRDCPLSRRRPLQVATRPDGRSLVLRFTARCPAGAAITLHSQLLVDADAGHRSLLRAQWGQAVPQAGVLSAERPRYTLRTQRAPMQTFSAYFREGIHHVRTGWDHLLFLLGLFLPVALRWSGHRWQPLDSPRQALRQASVVVTAFTLAHAATLCLAALGVLALPTRWVESAVAASVLFTGLNNLHPVVTRRLWLLAAAFGLIHGSAIAGALLELGLPAEGRVWALLGFNLGVEAAQLGLVLLGLPMALALRRWRGYVPAILVPGSALVALAGLIWFLDRALDLDWILPI
ncbi:MAG: HupE/UreJ family protein [Stagnimonas sp.]|nr:HupE/UreJ family protein [Stagnimonas sp.]